MSDRETDGTAERLCLSCGLCCNGVLFADVELRRGDSPEEFTALGLDLQRKGKKLAFQQPCRCFDGRLCNVYASRPEHCRRFQCSTLQRVSTGQTSPAVALKLIAAAKQQAQTVRQLLGELGDHQEDRPLSRRYARLMAEPLDFAAGEEAIECRAKLMLAVDTLMKMLQRDFLS